jgi:hypothetical protein
MNAVIEREVIRSMSPLEAEVMAYWSSTSYYMYKTRLEEYKDSVDLWYLQQLNECLDDQV